MSLIDLLVVVAVIGLLVFALTTLVPMPEQFRRAIVVIAVVVVCLWVLQLVVGPIAVPRVGR